MSRLDVVVDGLASNAAVVRLGGELVYEHAYTFETELQQIESTEPDTLVVDLRGLEFIDSVGLRGLLAARRRAARVGRRLLLVRGSPNVARLMVLAGVHDVFEVVDEIPADVRVAPAAG